VLKNKNDSLQQRLLASRCSIQKGDTKTKAHNSKKIVKTRYSHAGLYFLGNSILSLRMIQIRSVIDTGASGTIITAECHLSNNLPSIVIVGLGGKTIDESKERIRSAFASSNVSLPRKRITINLAPADIPKMTTALDLAMAVAILQAASPKAYLIEEGSIFLGELGLDGSVHPIRGIIGKIKAGLQSGFARFYVPEKNLEQALLIPGTTIFPVPTLGALYSHISGKKKINPLYGEVRQINTCPADETSKLSAISGQAQAKRAMTIAAAGGHNILLYGPPGTGKSMLAKAMPSLLPPLSHNEMLEITHIYSLATHQYEKLITERPFRAPHHTASHTSIIGGGSPIRPGEISLSHQGVLLLDEFPEFSRLTIEALRQPLEDRSITITRAKQSVAYPAKFIMVATANPCPCGYYGSTRQCICTARMIQTYHQKLSGPILDRIDIHVNVSIIDYNTLLQNHDINTSNHQLDVIKARARQYKRVDSEITNSELSNDVLRKVIAVDKAAITLLTMASEKLQLSARAYMRTLKVARTIADLDAKERVCAEHISEALQYRKNQLTIE
jgi:magnesium chelatase family protein